MVKDIQALEDMSKDEIIEHLKFQRRRDELRQMQIEEIVKEVDILDESDVNSNFSVKKSGLIKLVIGVEGDFDGKL